MKTKTKTNYNWLVKKTQKTSNPKSPLSQQFPQVPQQPNKHQECIILKKTLQKKTDNMKILTKTEASIVKERMPSLTEDSEYKTMDRG